jgi:hypothetical protein
MGRQIAPIKASATAMIADRVISRLSQVRQVAPGRWISRCPAHDDRSPSLSVRELDDGRVLVHCFAGCEVQSVLHGVGLTFSDLYPDSPISHRERRVNHNIRDLFVMAQHEAMIVLIAGADLRNGKPLNETDQDRLVAAVSRIGAMANA